MALTKEERQKLYAQAKQLRKDIVDVTSWAGGAHIGGGLSVIDILTILYFKYLNIDPERPDWEDRDRLVLSKGHAAVAYVPVLARRGFFDVEEMKTFNKFQSPFGMHPDCKRVRGCDASTGSLGHGLPMAVGMALGARVLGKDLKVYCILGDGECNEGSVWEALMAAAQYKLTNLVTIIDRNRLMIDGPTEEVMGIEPLADKLKAFGMEVVIVDGHDLDALSEVIEKARGAKERPVAILANTVKGKGIGFMEDQVPWHYGSVDAELKEKALTSIEKMYEAILKGVTA
jgi:transketolase